VLDESLADGRHTSTLMQTKPGSSRMTDHDVDTETRIEW
jgi:hypothetical protein